MRIGLIALARPTFDVAYAEEILASALLSLDALDHTFVGSRDLLFSNDDAAPVIDTLAQEELDAVLVLQVTFCDAGMVLDLAARTSCPVVVWGYPELRWGGRPRLNSLCGINLATHALRRAGKAYRFLYADPKDGQAIDAVLSNQQCAEPPNPVDAASYIEPQNLSQASEALRSLQQSRMGLVGQHPDGFETCRFDEADLAARFKIAIEPIALGRLFETADTVSDGDLALVRDRASRELEGLDRVDATATDKSLRLYAALRAIGSQDRLAGFAVRCWPEMFTDYGCAICGALGMLNEDAIPCACEADVLGNVTNLLLQALSGTPPWVVDLVHGDRETGTAVIWHCGLAPRSMASAQTKPKADIHANRKQPLLQAFALKPGPVTIARLSQATNGLSMVIGAATMIEAPMSFCGTSGVMRFDRSVGEVFDDLLAFGLEHHVSIAYGDYRGQLAAVAEQLEIPLYDLTASASAA